MKHALLLLAAAAAFAGFSADDTAAKLAPHYEMWETYGGKEVRAPRRQAEKAFKNTPVRAALAPSETVGLRWKNSRFLVDRHTGQPASLVLDGSRELVKNAATRYPFWTLTFLDKDGKERKLYPYDAEFLGAQPDKDKLTLKWRHALAEVTVTVKFTGAKEVDFRLAARNCSGTSRLFTVDFPRLSFSLPGKAADCAVEIPWRRGRLIPLSDLTVAKIQEYPGSSARFQLVSFYDKIAGKDGVCIRCEDARPQDKYFVETFIPAYDALNFRLRSFPKGRAVPGNSAEAEFSTRIGLFDGDWYDAAQIYRAWWLKQPFASRGPVWKNPDVPEFLKRAPLWLRFYTRQGTGDLPNRALNRGKRWHEFLPDVVFPATHYHYAVFSEENKIYPAAGYYGFCADIFPGLEEVVTELRKMNIRTNVFLQSSIVNQHDERNAILRDSAILDENGKMRNYLDVWQMCCRSEDVWLKRFLEMTDHVLNHGFYGVYIDTYGKRHVGKECMAATHGHDAGGGNANDQRKMGNLIRERVKAKNRDFYIGGEACCEFTVDILDYKLNATNGYNHMIPLERALYGDHIVSHGRVIRGNDALTDRRLIALDFVEGIIPGRFFNDPPADPAERTFLRNVVDLTKQALDYNRFGKLLRPLRFADEPEKLVIAETKLHTVAWHNNVFRSCRDDSVGVVAVSLNPGKQRNELLITPQVRREWNLPNDAAVWRVLPDGRREKVANWRNCTRIPVALDGCDIAFFIIR